MGIIYFFNFRIRLYSSQIGCVIVNNGAKWRYLRFWALQQSRKWASNGDVVGNKDWRLIEGLLAYTKLKTIRIREMTSSYFKSVGEQEDALLEFLA